MRIFYKNSIVVFFVLLSINSFSQIMLHGKVVSTMGNPIPYVTIGIPNKNIGVYSFQDGDFSILIEKRNTKDSLLFSSIGYKSKLIPIHKLLDSKKVIELEEVAIQLEEITISNRNGKELQYGIFKKNSSSKIGIKNPNEGAEVSLLITPDILPFEVDEIVFNIKRENTVLGNIRIRFYDVNPVSKKPGDILNNEEIIYLTKKDDGVIHLKLEHSIVFKKPFYISLEWLIDRKIVAKILESERKIHKILQVYRKEVCKGCTGVLNNNKIFQIEDGNGNILSKKKLTKKERKSIKAIKVGVPAFYFQTTHSEVPTYYRYRSHGKWYKYQQSLIAGTIGF